MRFEKKKENLLQWPCEEKLAQNKAWTLQFPGQNKMVGHQEEARLVQSPFERNPIGPIQLHETSRQRLRGKRNVKKQPCGLKLRFSQKENGSVLQTDLGIVPRLRSTALQERFLFRTSFSSCMGALCEKYIV